VTASKAHLTPADRRTARYDERAAKRAARELKEDAKREAIEHEIAGSRAGRLIAEIERQALKALEHRLPPGQSALAWGRFYANPSPRSMRASNGNAPIAVAARPTSASGVTSFHFKHQALTKGEALALAIRKPTAVRRLKAVAASHQRYIERDVALERSAAAASQNYIEDDVKGERTHDDEVSGLTTLSSFGNLPDDPGERLAFWRTVEEHERVPTVQLRFNPHVAQDITGQARKKIRDNGMFHPAVVAALASESVVTVATDVDAAMELIDLFHQAGQHGGFALDEPTAGLKLRPNPPQPLQIRYLAGGTIQTRFVAELPYEMNAEQRRALAEEYCAPFAAAGLPFWGAIHAPTATNDPRNVHLHVNIYDRPSWLITLPDGRKVWSFAHVEQQRDEKNRKWRPNRPFKCNKMPEFSDPNFIQTERKRFCNLTNKHLEKAGIKRRVHAGTYEEMGIEKAARSTVTRTDYALEQRGEVTPTGQLMARREWLDRLLEVTRKITQNYETAKLEADRNDTEMRARLASVAPGVDADAINVSSNDFRSGRMKQSEYIEQHDALRFVSERLTSRVRLLPKTKRDEASKAVLAVAAMLETDATACDNAQQEIGRHIQSIKAVLENVAPTTIRQPDAAPPKLNKPVNWPKPISQSKNAGAAAKTGVPSDDFFDLLSRSARQRKQLAEAEALLSQQKYNRRRAEQQLGSEASRLGLFSEVQSANIDMHPAADMSEGQTVITKHAAVWSKYKKPEMDAGRRSNSPSNDRQQVVPVDPATLQRRMIIQQQLHNQKGYQR
jgi:MobA/MobL family